MSRHDLIIQRETQQKPSFESQKETHPKFFFFCSLSIKVLMGGKNKNVCMQIYFLGYIGRLLIIFFASVQTSCLNEVNRIDLHAFFSIPRSHEPSKECTLFHAGLMNGLHLRFALSHAQCVPPGCLGLIFPRHSPSRRDEPFIRLLARPCASTTKTLSLQRSPLL